MPAVVMPLAAARRLPWGTPIAPMVCDAWKIPVAAPCDDELALWWCEWNGMAP